MTETVRIGNDTAIVAYSGGKDSTATLLWALDHYARVIPVFCDTKAEWPETYEYLDYVEQKLCLAIIRISGKWSGGLFEWVEHYRFWPTMWARGCTTELKKQPMTRWLRGQPPHDLLFGQRAEESAARALLPMQQGNLLRPVLRWSRVDVINYIRSKGLKMNPVYAFVDRANCCVCPLGKPSGIREFQRRYPMLLARWLQMENQIGHSWRDSMTLRQAAQVEQGSLFETTDYSECLLDGLCDLGDGEK